MKRLAEGFAAGYASLSARADLLDRINVFPVADGDTGANLRISLGPLRACGQDMKTVAAQLSRSATGNSGNIAAAFFSEFLRAEGIADLPDRAFRGRTKAWQAVALPLTGTMLSVFDSLAEVLARTPVSHAGCAVILAAMQDAVLMTTSTLADLRLAGVVDSGALGMFVFFDGFFRAITGYSEKDSPLLDLFPGRLKVSADFRPEASDAYCVDAIIRPAAGSSLSKEAVAELGESVVVMADQAQLKIHIHTADPQELRMRLTTMGEVVSWSDEPLDMGRGVRQPSPDPAGCLHIMTDAAGSLPRELAWRHNISLLDSYIVSGDTARPESLCSPETIYALLRQGNRVTTAQASLAERQQLYRSVCEQFGRTLYLCVGSAFTGNYGAAMAWKKEHDAGNLLDVIDTGAASGRLGVISLLAARAARETGSADAVRAYARSLVDSCREYVFIDTLRYLVAGGRVSRAGGFLGDLLRMKPVISPTREGVRRVGVVRNRQAQLAFALEKVAAEAVDRSDTFLLLQYSDNRAWVEEVVHRRLEAVLPEAEITLVPLSLTSGVHMGPGAWSLAFAPKTMP
jgi:uncharacterized protein